jgi:hypothetical protein
MNTATIDVQYVNPPAAGKKMGNLKLKDGSYYSVSPAMLGQFRNGGTYEVTYDEHDYNGKMYRTVKTVKQTGAAVNGTGGGRYGATDDVTARRIFICGILNGLAHAGKISTPTDAQKWWRGLEQAWENVHKPTITTGASYTKEESQDDLNDEIPF